MLYHSTRSKQSFVTSKQAILEGIAPDGGLFVSDELFNTQLDFASCISDTYQELALKVLSLLLDDFSHDELCACVEAAYGSNFDTPQITPVTKLGNSWLLELFHGPTCAFKDVALQILPQFMNVAKQTLAPHTDIEIVCATSGDTGKAALAGFSTIPHMGVCVFYPQGKVSDIQRLQMVTQTGEYVCVAAVKGNFDDAQREVKNIFANRALEAQLKDTHVVLSSANSINVGRLVPQIVYYAYAYLTLVKDGVISFGAPVDFCVPTGNFGDVLAGWYAKQLGLPVGKLIVASNSNKVLCDLIKTGTYDKNRAFVKTISPSMDILVSSNFERLLYYLSDGDTSFVTECMNELSTSGSYALPLELHERLKADFSCGYATDDDTQKDIAATFETTGKVLDPHTAVAHFVMQQHPSQNVQVCLATASPYKFAADVLHALDPTATPQNGFDAICELQKLSHTTAPQQLTSLKDALVLHTRVCEVHDMAQAVLDCAKTLGTGE